MTRATRPTTNWAGNITFRAATVHHPESVPELQRLVAAAGHLRALGSGHSFNTIADSPGDLVSLAAMPSTVDIDTERSAVTVGGGIRYGELTGKLHAAGYALHNLGSLPHISVAGACATGTHGSGTGSLATAVRAVELVTASGDTLRLDRADARFPGSVVALGALGIVTALTLDIQPSYQVTQNLYTGLPLAVAAARLAAVMSGGYSVSLFTDWGPVVGQAWVKRRVDAAAPGGAAPGGAPPDVPWAELGATPAAQPLHPIAGMPPEHCTEQLGVPGPWHERLPHFRHDFTPSHGDELQSEYFVPAEHGPAAIEAVATLRDTIQPVLLTSEIRTVTADPLWLSPAHGRDSVALHFTWIQDTPVVLPVVAAVEERLAPFAPRPHWGKVFAMDPDTVRASYPRMPDFQRLARELDPTGKFRNEFLDRYLGGGGARGDGGLT